MVRVLVFETRRRRFDRAFVFVARERRFFMFANVVQYL